MTEKENTRCTQCGGHFATKQILKDHKKILGHK